jgi:glucosamine-6-phosphate deaminase
MPLIERRTLGGLRVEVYSTRAEMGAAAGAAAAAAITAVQDRRTGPVRVIFAAAPSQNETLAALAADPDLDWSRVVAFQMDDYVGLPATASERFSAYLQEHLYDLVRPGSIHRLEGTGDVDAEIQRYASLLTEDPIDLCLFGIGENGHLAFNDPPTADFSDPLVVKRVELDYACRIQQVNDGCFPTFEDVPPEALTLTVPALIAARTMIGSVPGSAKREAVNNTLWGPVTTDCPATAIRGHEDATLYLDADSWPGEPG